jgi:hypothetical protein
MPAREFVNRRWIRRAASGPVISYLQVEKRSQIPVPVRIASYSTAGSVPVLDQHLGAPRLVPVRQRRAVLLLGHRSSSSVVVVDPCRRRSVRARAAGHHFYRIIERPFKSTA